MYKNQRPGCFLMILPAIIFLILIFTVGDVGPVKGTLLWIIFFIGFGVLIKGKERISYKTEIKSSLEEIQKDSTANHEDYFNFEQDRSITINEDQYTEKISDQLKSPKPTYPSFIVPPIIQYREKMNEVVNDYILKSKIGVSKDINKKYTAGISENQFHKTLIKWFPDKIYMGVGLYSFNVKTIFVPDFLFYDEITNFHLAIEIDEPYSFIENRPTHWISDDYGSKHWATLLELDDTIIKYDRKSFGIKDVYTRTNEFTRNGWFLVRFSEKQVVCQPDSCCKFIVQKVSKYLDSDMTNINFKNFEDLKLDEMWTLDEAKQMAIEKYRNSYLPIHNLKSFIAGCRSYEEYFKKSECFEQDVLPF